MRLSATAEQPNNPPLKTSARPRRKSLGFMIFKKRSLESMIHIGRGLNGIDRLLSRRTATRMDSHGRRLSGWTFKFIRNDTLAVNLLDEIRLPMLPRNKILYGQKIQPRPDG